MQKKLDRILPVNLILNTLIFYMMAKIYIFPVIPNLSAQAILIPILLLHSFRHLGLMFLSPGATKKGLPLQFAYPAAIGDLIPCVLAFVSIFALLLQISFSLSLVWIFNIVGTIDLILAIILGIIYKAEVHFGASYWIPAFWVPALLVTHYITFILLLREWI